MNTRCRARRTHLAAVGVLSCSLSWGAGAVLGDGTNYNYDGGGPNNDWCSNGNWNRTVPPLFPNALSALVTLDNFDDPELLCAGEADGEITVGTLTMLGSAKLSVGGTDLRVNTSMSLDQGSDYGPLPSGAAAANLFVGGNLDLKETVDSANQVVMTLNGTMGLSVVENLTVGGSGSCTPPDLEVTAAADVNILKDFIIETNAVINYTSSVKMCLSGNFDNRCKSPTTVNLNQQRIESRPMCVAVPSPQPGPNMAIFEAAGNDLGPSAAGFTNNFAMEELVVATGRTLLVLDAFDNNDLIDECGESLYVNQLVLEAGSTLQMGNANVYYIHLVNQGGQVEEPKCGQLIPITEGIPAITGWGAALSAALTAAAGVSILIRRRSAHLPAAGLSAP